jgi:hypothetical protein
MLIRVANLPSSASHSAEFHAKTSGAGFDAYDELMRQKKHALPPKHDKGHQPIPQASTRSHTDDVLRQFVASGWLPLDCTFSKARPSQLTSSKQQQWLASFAGASGLAASKQDSWPWPGALPGGSKQTPPDAFLASLGPTVSQAATAAIGSQHPAHSLDAKLLQWQAGH